MNPQNYGLIFHHFGLAVSDIDQALPFMKGLGYSPGELIYDPQQNVNLIWCDHPQMPSVEIIASNGNPGPLDHYLSNMSDLIYHICFLSQDVKSSLSAIRNDKIRVLPVSPPKPAVLFDWKEVSFYIIKGFGLVELLQS